MARQGAAKLQQAPAPLPFEALPTPRQVVAAVPFGRRDPFGNLPVAQQAAGLGGSGGGGGSPAEIAAAQAEARRAMLLLPPAGLRLTGVLQSGARSEAVVEYKDASGSLHPGDRGGVTTELLPLGWSVAAIDIHSGQMTLQHGGRRVVLKM
ncbi:MAG: hypothetical protein VKI83_07645 [Synechococcaceae cyanobacterium]|nr:hypothetical protein [Synechococcaceae cyanobacterium]